MESQLWLVMCCVVLRCGVEAAWPELTSGQASEQQEPVAGVKPLLQSMFFTQLETRAVLEELSHALAAHLLHQAETLEETEVKKNVTDHLLQEVQLLQEKVQQQESEVRRVKDESRQNEEELERLQASSRELQAENEQLKTDARLKEEEVWELKTDIRVMEGENDRLKTDKLLLGGDIRQLKSQVRLTEGENQQQKTDIRLLEIENQKLKIDVRLLEVRNQQLTSDVREAEDGKQEAEGELRRLQEGDCEAGEANSKLQQAQEESSRCTAEVRRLTEEVHQVKAINRQIQGTERQLQNDRTSLQNMQEEENHRLEEQRQNLQEQVQKLKETERGCQRNLTHTVQRHFAKDCAELRSLGVTESGVYLIFPSGWRAGVRVWCDMVSEGGGWTVFLARRPHSPQQNFATTWCSYRQGFGDPRTEYWLGNDHLHALTGTTAHSLRVEAVNLQGQRRLGQWNLFTVGNEASRYMLQVGQYVPSSTLGDGLVSHYSLNGKEFSTIDKDHDTWPSASCAAARGGAGWWFGYCSRVNPTGPLGQSDTNTVTAHWEYFTPHDRMQHGLSQLYMMIRPNHHT